MYNLVSVRMSLLEGSQGVKKPSDNNGFKNKVYNSILELVGNTPLVKLNKIPKDHGLTCDIYAKCEFMNPGGSIKYRAALAMVQDAEKAGVVNNKTNFVEPTSGNTGIGIAMNAALLGTKCTIVTGEKNSSEKVETMRLLGAEVIPASDEIAYAQQLKRANPDTVVVLNQFENIMNPMTHFETTGTEILSALDKVDMVVLGAGTGGTLSGLGLRLKQYNPNCIVVAAEPDGSILINKTGKEHSFLVEGVGGTWVPKVLDPSLVDHFEVITDQESFLAARELAQKEGLLCGGSSGTAMCAAIKATKALNIGAGEHVVVILPDGIRNYMSKFVNDQWMEANLFMTPPEHSMSWWRKPITELKLTHKYPLLKNNVTCELAFNAMKDANIAVITDDKGKFIGAISKESFRNAATNPIKLSENNLIEFRFKDLATKYLVKNCYTLAENGKTGMPTIGLLSRILDISPFVIIGQERPDIAFDYFDPKGVVTADDVLDYIHTSECSPIACNLTCRGWAP